MFYWLIDLSNTVPFLSPFRTILNVFRYTAQQSHSGFAGRMRLSTLTLR